MIGEKGRIELCPCLNYLSISEKEILMWLYNPYALELHLAKKGTSLQTFFLSSHSLLANPSRRSSTN